LLSNTLYRDFWPISFEGASGWYLENFHTGFISAIIHALSLILQQKKYNMAVKMTG